MTSFKPKHFRLLLPKISVLFSFVEFGLALPDHSSFSNSIQLCASDNSERRTRALLTFPKYPASGEAKTSKPVSSPVMGKPLLLFWSIAVRCHSENITMSLQPSSPRKKLWRKTEQHRGHFTQCLQSYEDIWKYTPLNS